MDSDASNSLNNQPVTKDSKPCSASTLTSRTETKEKALNPVKYTQMLTKTKIGLENVNTEAISLTGDSVYNQSETEPSTLLDPQKNLEPESSTLLIPNNQPESESSRSLNPSSQPELVASPILNPNSQSEVEPSTIIEAKYYHIDSFINQLMDIQLE